MRSEQVLTGAIERYFQSIQTFTLTLSYTVRGCNYKGLTELNDHAVANLKDLNDDVFIREMDFQALHRQHIGMLGQMDLRPYVDSIVELIARVDQVWLAVEGPLKYQTLEWFSDVDYHCITFESYLPTNNVQPLDPKIIGKLIAIVEDTAGRSTETAKYYLQQYGHSIKDDIGSRDPLVRTVNNATAAVGHKRQSDTLITLNRYRDKLLPKHLDRIDSMIRNSKS
jgi:hypothetical protein